MQDAVTKNYFELFELPVTFDIDLNVLTQRYRELQHAVHPDKFANATDRERMLAVQQTSLINEAHTSLKDPLLRARYMLSLAGVDITNEPETVMDTEFLMQQMELREQLAEIKGSQDALTNLDNFMANVKSELKKRIQTLSELLSDLNTETQKQAYALTQQMQFLYKLQSEAEQIEETLL